MNKTLLTLALAALSVQAQAALNAGDIAIIGFIDNGTPDSFAFVTLADVAANEVVYFTDNGWTGAGFRSGSGTDGNGNESLIKWTATSAIAAGTIISSASTSASYAWTNSGAIPGSASGTFGDLAFNQSGEQIYAFQASASLPLQNPTQHLFVLDDTNGFEHATDSSTGSIPTGLTSGINALTLNLASANFVAVNDSVLTGQAKTKAQWLATFADSANWTSAASGSLPVGSIAIASPAPEPESYALFLAGLGLVGLMARRQRG